MAFWADMAASYVYLYDLLDYVKKLSHEWFYVSDEVWHALVLISSLSWLFEHMFIACKGDRVI